MKDNFPLPIVARLLRERCWCSHQALIDFQFLDDGTINDSNNKPRSALNYIRQQFAPGAAVQGSRAAKGGLLAAAATDISINIFRV